MSITLRWMASFSILVVATLGQTYARELPTPPTSATVPSGERTRVGKAFDLNPDCSSGGKITARLIEKPADGLAEIVNERGFTEYEKDAQAYKCNEKESDITKFYYTSNGGFKGKDGFTVEVFYPNGNYRKRVFNIDVR